MYKYFSSKLSLLGTMKKMFKISLVFNVLFLVVGMFADNSDITSIYGMIIVLYIYLKFVLPGLSVFLSSLFWRLDEKWVHQINVFALNIDFVGLLLINLVVSFVTGRAIAYYYSFYLLENLLSPHSVLIVNVIILWAVSAACWKAFHYPYAQNSLNYSRYNGQAECE